jgi:NAD(P)-dependent dehydrogenase (short-subunit alcohol dehydrogenase family)
VGLRVLRTDVVVLRGFATFRQVTGGNGGLGLEMSVALCEAGAKIHALDLPSKPSSDFQACIDYVQKLNNGSELVYHSVDVTDPKGLSTLIIDEIAKKQGRLDLCVAAAGILGPAEGESCMTYSAEDWDKVMKVNLSGVFWSCQAAARGMVETGCKHGSIVMIASMSGSITNKVGTTVEVCIYSGFETHDDVCVLCRTNLGSPIIRRNPACFSWPEAWHAS